MARKKSKNIGRVKRYKRSFYEGPGYWVKKVGIWAAAAALIFGLGFFVAPAVIDWGTHTWYTVVKGMDLPDPTQPPRPGSSGPSQPVATPAPAVTPTPAPTATPEPEVVAGKMAVVSLSALRTPEGIEKMAADLKAQGAVYALITLKDTSGYLYYDSALPAAAGGIAATTIDPAAVAAALKAQGIRPVAGIAAFQDPLVSRELGIHYTGMDYMWLDNRADAGGKRWMNPYSADAVAYIGDLIGEACDMGFETVVLSAVQFPRQESAKQDFGDTQGRSRAEQLRADMDVWNDRFAGKAELWYEVPYESCIAASSTLGGAAPAQLGIRNLMLSMPAQQNDEDPAATDLPVSQQQIMEDMLAAGIAHLIVRDGNAAQVIQ